MDKNWSNYFDSQTQKFYFFNDAVNQTYEFTWKFVTCIPVHGLWMRFVLPQTRKKLFFFTIEAKQNEMKQVESNPIDTNRNSTNVLHHIAFQ